MSTHVYYADDVTLNLPPGFEDRTVNVLEWSLEGGGKLALVIQREPLPPAPVAPTGDTALSRYVASQLEGYAARFTGYRLERAESSAPGSPFEVERRAFRWAQDQDVLYQHQAFVHLGARVVLLTVAVKARDREIADRVIDEALVDLRARGEFT